MKIVTIFAMGSPGSSNRKLHYDFFKELPNSKNFILTKQIKMETKEDVQRISNKYKPDVVIIYQGRTGGRRINNGIIKHFKCMKVMVEVDFWEPMEIGYNEPKGFSFYKDNQFDLIIQRGSYTTKGTKVSNIPSVWLPYSADENLFKPNDNKINKVGFAGTATKSYPNRQRIIKLLEKRDFFIRCKDCNGTDNLIKYPLFISNLSVGLNVVEDKEIRTPFGKLFEYAACKTSILSMKFDHMDLLFGKNNIVKYNRSGNNIDKKAKSILNDTDRRNEISNNLYEMFLKHHTHKIRINEAYNIIKTFYEKGDVVRKWGL